MDKIVVPSIGITGGVQSCTSDLYIVIMVGQGVADSCTQMKLFAELRVCLPFVAHTAAKFAAIVISYGVLQPQHQTTNVRPLQRIRLSGHGPEHPSPTKYTDMFQNRGHQYSRCGWYSIAYGCQ